MNQQFGPFIAHPTLAMLPLMEGEEFQRLVQDIKLEGLRQPITLNHDGTILIDGRNRYRACEAATVDPVFEKLPARYTHDMINSFIASANLHRRHIGRLDASEIEMTDGVLTVTLPGLTAVRIDTQRGLIAIDGVSGYSNGSTEWTVHDLRNGVYGDFHRLRPADACADPDCTKEHIA